LEFVPYQEAYSSGFEDLSRRRPDIQKLVALTGFKPSTGIAAVIRRVAAMKTG
jgi:UDP-glucose 4-epimerase